MSGRLAAGPPAPSLPETPPQAGSLFKGSHLSVAAGNEAVALRVSTCHAQTHGAAEGKERDGGRLCAALATRSRGGPLGGSSQRVPSRDET